MEVSVVVIAYNEQAYIKKCLTAILNQSFLDFELLIVNDGSTDGTASVINSIHDERIRHIRNNKNFGIAESRNVGFKYARGRYIFFTNADCVPIKYWIEEGLKMFKEKRCVGVVGKTFYATAKTTISDRIVEDLEGRYYGAYNIAYTKEILDKVGGFDPKYNLCYEDQDIAFRIKRYGEIIFSKDMIVIHQRKKFTPRNLFRHYKRAENTVLFIKNYPHYRNIDIRWKRILYPRRLLILLCPLLLIPYYSFRNWQDIKLIPFIYFSSAYLRFIVWKTAIKEKILLI